MKAFVPEQAVLRSYPNKSAPIFKEAGNALILETFGRAIRQKGILNSKQRRMFEQDAEEDRYTSRRGAKEAHIETIGRYGLEL